MNFYYNPLDKNCKSITGGIAAGKTITFTVFADGNECFLDFNRDGRLATKMPMQRIENGFSISLKINETGLYFYRFLCDGTYFGRGDFRLAKKDSATAYQLTVHSADFSTPEWFKGGVMYQIFPDRFAKKGDLPIGKGKILRTDWGGTPIFQPNAQGIVKNNDFFGGNLQGIISKLDYLKGLNVSVIYLNPIFEAASNHRYDTGNYKKIDGLLGSKTDFEALVSEAEKRGIKIILDGVFNHTGDDSVYFNRYGNYDSVGAYQDFNSPYREWFDFYEYPDGYNSWWGIDTLPAVNEQSTAYQNFICGEDGVLKYWLETGIGGYRLDVADELPDFFLKMVRTAIKDKNPEALIVGEVWEEATDKIAYGTRREYFQGDELDSVMNYPLKDAIIDYILSGNTIKLAETIDMLVDDYPKNTLDCLMNILSTHDTSRILTVLGGKIVLDKESMAVTDLSVEEKIKAIEEVKMAAVLQFTLPGVPCIYYGDENAMEGYADPFCRKCFDWNNLNEDLIAFYQKIGNIRHQYNKIFGDGEYVEVYRNDELLLFARVKNDDVCYVYTNNSSKSMEVSLNEGEYYDLIQNREIIGNKLSILPYSYGIFIKK